MTDPFSIFVAVLGILVGVAGTYYARQQALQSKNSRSQLESIHDIANSAVLTKDSGRHTDDLKTIALMSAPTIDKLTEMAMKRLFDWEHIHYLEVSERVRGVWIFTPDLLPDREHTSEIAKMVAKNLKLGRSYFYFIPSGVPKVLELKKTLRSSLGQGDTDTSGVKIVELPESFAHLFEEKANIAVYFSDAQHKKPYMAFKEISEARELKLGLLWQKLPDEYMHLLVHRIEAFLTSVEGNRANLQLPPC